MPIVAYIPSDKSDLKVGAKVFIVAARQPEGTLQGRAWRVGREAKHPKAGEDFDVATFVGLV